MNQAIDDVSALVSNVNLMVSGGAIEDAIERFRGRSDLCLGLEFAVNGEWATRPTRPVSPPELVPSLVRDDGTFFPSPWELPAGHVYAPEDVERELRAQFAFLRARGVAPRYLDGHMAVFLLTPEIGAIAHRVAREEGIPAVYELPKLRHGPYDGDRDAALARWARLLAADPLPRLAVFHVAVADGCTETLSAAGRPPAFPARAAEHALLRDPRFAALLREAGITVARLDAPPALPC